MVGGHVGAQLWTPEGKASHLPHPPLFTSELEMSPLLTSEVWDGEKWESWDLWREPPI